MNQHSSLLYAFLLSVLLLGGTLIPAGGTDRKNDSPWSGGIGIGSRIGPLYQGSSVYGVSALPLLRVSYADTISLGPRGLRVHLRDSESYSLDAGLGYHPGRDELADNDFGTGRDERLRGLGDIDGAIGLRLRTSTEYSAVRLRGSITKFTGRDNNGVRGSVSLGTFVPLTDDLILIPRVGTVWASQEYNQTFFGVTNSQATSSNFEQFSAGSGFNSFRAGITGRSQLSDNWSWRLRIRGEHLLGDASGSPVSKTDSMVSVLSGFMYRL